MLTATVASVFVKEHTDANKEVFKKGHDELGQQLSVISDRLADVERRLGATPADMASVDAAADAEAAANGPIEPDQGASTLVTRRVRRAPESPDRRSGPAHEPARGCQGPQAQLRLTLECHDEMGWPMNGIDSFFHHVLTWTGTFNESGGWYGFWSGFAGGFGILTILVVGYRKINCHTQRCWRIGHHDLVVKHSDTDPGTTYRGVPSLSP